MKEHRCKILVVNDHKDRRQMLVNLIQQQVGPKTCLEADSVHSASQAIDKQPVSFVIVEIAPHSKNSVRLAESIKLHCPKIPILAVSPERITDRDVDNSNNDIGLDKINRIMAGIQYMESLTNSGLSGFTVAVNI
ncbi:MAG: hypothetical protein JW804_09225 [Sedimentisphaerales bacterium]|nr:hypothetical protein [Sedimentisphaerales bacterium]